MTKAERILADAMLTDQLNLFRFEAGERNRVLAVLLRMQIELREKLLNGFTDYGKARLRVVLNQTTKVINAYYAEAQGVLDLDGLAQHEIDATTKAFAQIGVEASIPTSAVMQALVSESLLQGAPLADWWAKQAQDTAFKFTAQVRQGIAQGETLQQIVTRIVGSVKHGTPGIMQETRRNASTLVHDAVMQVANDSKMAVYRANDDVIKGYRQLSTLDSHTSATCMAYSGAQWDMDLQPVGSPKLPYNNGCPRHPNCRSLILAVLKTYRELGVDIPEKAPGTRSSDLGQIEADTSFKDFLARHDTQYVDELLGKGRAAMYRDGKITLPQLVDGTGRELTLKQLRERYQ